MDQNQFDKQIKSSLENLEVPFDGNSWLALESRMNTALTEEQPAAVEPVDLVVKRTFDRMEVAFEPAHWTMLNNRLDRELTVRRVRNYKIAEAAIFLLLLVNIEGFLGGFKEVLQPSVPPQPKSSLPMADLGKNKRHSSKHSVKSDTENSASLLETMAALISDHLAGSDGSAQPTNQTDVVALQTSAPVSGSLLDGANFYNASGPINFALLQLLPQSKTPDFAWNKYLESIPGVDLTHPHRATGWYAASYAGTDRNSFKSENFFEKTRGYSMGASIGYRKGKWGVETGLAYSSKDFSPKKAPETYAGDPVTGLLAAYVSEVNADIFSVPVKVTRRLAQAGKTRIHAVAGVTASVATQKRVGYRSVYYPPSSPDPVPAPDPGQYPLPRKNTEGLFEGGSLHNNGYVTADLGLRIERPIGKRYVAFVEPVYRKTMAGSFGTRNERVSTFSLQAGVMAAL